MNDKEYLENITILIEDPVTNKVNKFEQSVTNNDEFNDPYKLENPIIHRHLLTKTIEEIRQQFEKDERQFRIDFDED